MSFAPFASLQVPVISWHKGDTELDLNSDPRYSHPSGGTAKHKLVINNAHISDSGLYCCIATTKSAVITSSQAQLIVHNKPGVFVHH